jgi:hypothetical protein
MSGWVACLELGRIGNAMREHGQGNPRSPYVGIIAMIPGPRASYPRDGPMSCGDQPAHISLIHRRYKSARRVTYTVRLAPSHPPNAYRGVASANLAPVDRNGPYQGLSH